MNPQKIAGGFQSAKNYKLRGILSAKNYTLEEKSVRRICGLLKKASKVGKILSAKNYKLSHLFAINSHKWLNMGERPFTHFPFLPVGGNGKLESRMEKPKTLGRFQSAKNCRLALSAKNCRLIQSAKNYKLEGFTCA